MSTALVLGVTGQDGSHLAELLLEMGYSVTGVTRRREEDARCALPAGIGSRVKLATWDFRDDEGIEKILHTVRPVEVYNCAAISSGAGMFDDPIGIGQINGLAVVKMLEAIRRVDPRIRFCQASSSEVFADAAETPQTERTPPAPRSPYGAAKCYADAMVRCYRNHFGMFSCSAILFNHESPRRGPAFVTKKIAREAARIKRGLATELRLGNLSSARDWGFAGDSVRAMWLMLQTGVAEDFVVATGLTHTVREFCEIAFSHVGLDYRDYVREDAAEFRQDETGRLVGDSSKARSRLGWEPATGFEDLVTMMVNAELSSLGSEGLNSTTGRS